MKSFLNRIRSFEAAALLAAAMSGVPAGFGQQTGLQTLPNAVGERLRPEPRPRKLSRQEKREADQWGKQRMLDAQAKRLKRQARNKQNALASWQYNNAHDSRFWPFSANADRHFASMV